MMHACILGAGIVGLATAYELQRKGWQVTIVDAQEEAGMGTSAGNGAQLSYAYVQPLADPSIFKQLPKLLFSPDSPLKFRFKFDPHQWAWGMSFLAACNTQRSHVSTADLLALSAISRHGYDEMLTHTNIACDYAQAGKLVLLPSSDAIASAQKQIDLQASLGSPLQRVVTADEAVGIEPALQSYAHEFAAAVYTPSECVADCLAVCRGLQAYIRAQGGQWLPRTKALAFIADTSRIRAVRTTQGDIEADLFVNALGWQSQALLAPFGVRLPIYPLKGYSITIPVQSDTSAPFVSVTDSKRKVVFARLGQRLRVAGMVELVGDNLEVEASKIESLCASTKAVFPHIHLPSESDIHPWAGMRPATPTGVPITEKVKPYDNLWVNAGHGALGFTLAFGSAHRLVAQLS